MMKSLMKKSVALVSLLGFLLMPSSALTAYDVKYAALQNAVEDYFSMRQRSFFEASAQAPIPKGPATSLQSAENIRAGKIRQMKTAAAMTIVDADVSASIKSIKPLSDTICQMEVYEWTWVDYKMEGSGVTDRMGFGTSHDMMAEKTGSAYTIKEDLYDESLLTGAYTVADEAAKVPEAVQAAQRREKAASLPIAEDAAQAYRPSAAAPSSTAAVPAGVNYLPAYSVAYADLYVIHKSTSGRYDSYYNSAYGYFGNDCCNFVSQCLIAGNMPQDSTADVQVGFWMTPFPSPRYENYSWSSVASRSIGSFRNYFKNKGYTEALAATDNIYYGNPVYTTGHMTICTGKNSSGVPILNAHTGDWYHVPYTLFTFGGTKYTMMMTETNLANVPASHDFGTLTAKNTDHIKIFSVPAGSIYFYKFTITAGQQVNISINSTQTNYTVLYENQHVEDGKTMYLYEVTKKAGKSYTLSSSTLAAGTYYISIRSSPSSWASGTLVISLA